MLTGSVLDDKHPESPRVFRRLHFLRRWSHENRKTL
jgi:hypothetical protein